MAKRKEDAPEPLPPGETIAQQKAEARRSGKKKHDEEHPETLLGHLRGWADALVLAFLLAMFIRTYAFELFMIPTGSMTPTLIGDDARLVTETDWDGDGREDIVLVGSRSGPNLFQVHLRGENGAFNEMLLVDSGVSTDVRRAFADPTVKGAGRRDMILVNKFAYWFQQPDRGDIAVFKVPDRPTRGQPYDPTKPVYIKRVIGLPGETVEISGVAGYARREPGDPGRRTPAGHEGIEWAIQTNPLRIDGEPLVGEPYDHIHYLPSMSVGPGKPTQGGDPQILQVGPDEIYMLGDNQRSSSDSRYWGGVPVNHMRGKAILRYWPWRAVGFLPREG